MRIVLARVLERAALRPAEPDLAAGAGAERRVCK
jgi:hypothetical protein